MVYQDVNFLESVKKAVTFGKQSELIDVIGGGIGRAVAKDKKGVIDAINKSGMKIPSDISDNDLLKGISYQFASGNKAVIQAVLSVVVANEEGYSNDVTPILGGIGDIMQGVGNIVGGITGVFSAKEGTKQAQEGTKQAEEAKRTAALNMLGASQQALAASYQAAGVSSQEAQKTKKVMIIVGGIGLVAVLGIIAYVLVKSKSTEAK